MTPEQQRIAIAEACGWVRIQDSCGYTIEAKHPDGRVAKNIDEIPNYLSDLNAMHGAEDLLTSEQQLQYVDKLGDVVCGGHGDGSYGECWLMSHATAVQRAEAFLRTLGLWKE